MDRFQILTGRVTVQRYESVQSLMTLQALYGVIPNINGKGDCAKVRICPITDDVTSTVWSDSKY